MPSTISVIGALLSQVAFVTGVLYYFGWAYSHAYFAYFGVDAGALGFTTQEYVLRSVNSLFRPGMFTLLAVLVLLAGRWLPELHARWSRRPRRTLRRWVGVTGAIGVALTVAVVIAMFVPTNVAGPVGIYAPFVLLAGMVCSGFASRLRWKYRSLLGIHAPRTAADVVASKTRMLVLIAIGMVAYVWAVAAYADRRGLDDAQRAASDHFIDKPSVLLFSVDRLGIDGAGAQVGEIMMPGEKYRYVYSGLWLLARTTDRYYLLPQLWQAKTDRVFVIKDGDTIRIDIARNP
ncbi:hypothetical protein [Nocardia sp. NBC_00403]|uniref:hypothetical protein n=1 Tax=Nocardia sp. NBC_00403 TaxID=2975990 RepID=UPI002E1BB57B